MFGRHFELIDLDDDDSHLLPRNSNLLSRNIIEGRIVDMGNIHSCSTQQILMNAPYNNILNMENMIFPNRVREFYQHYRFDRRSEQIEFRLQGHNYIWTLAMFSECLQIPREGIKYFCQSRELTHLDHGFNNFHIDDICKKIEKQRFHCNGKIDVHQLKPELATLFEHVRWNIMCRTHNATEVMEIEALIIYWINKGIPLHIGYLVATCCS